MGEFFYQKMLLRGKTLYSEMLFLSVSCNLLTNLLHRNARLRQIS